MCRILSIQPPQWRIKTTLLLLLLLLLSVLGSFNLVSTNAIIIFILNLHLYSCFDGTIPWRNVFDTPGHYPLITFLLMLALPSIVMADELDDVITKTVQTLAGPAAAVVASTMVGSLMDNIQQFTKGEQEINDWTPKYKKSIIVIIIFRVTPTTRGHNDGLSQIIVCVIGVYLLNVWGRVSGQTYEIFPQVISLDGTRQEPQNCPGYIDLFGVIAKHSALSNRDVIVLARTVLRYAQNPNDIDLIQTSISEILDKRRERNSRMAINSCALTAMDSYHIPVKVVRALEHECENIIIAGEGTHKCVTQDYENEVSPENKNLQVQTNILVEELRVSLDSPDGDLLRQQIADGYIPPDDTDLPDLSLHTMLNNEKSVLEKGEAERRRVVSDMIKYVLRNNLSSNFADVRAVSFSRRSRGCLSDSIGVSPTTDMGGAQYLPQHQVSANVSSLNVVSDITDYIAFLHAEGASRDTSDFRVWHARLLVLLISSKAEAVAVSTLVRFGANMVIVTTILEFMRQLECTLITADCIGYDILKQATNEELRKLTAVLERSKVVEAKEDIVAGLSAEMQLQHYALAAAGRVDVMAYEEAKEVRAQISGDVFQYWESRKLRKSMMEGGKSGVDEDCEMTAGGASMSRDSDGDSDSDKKMLAVSRDSDGDSDKKMPAAKGSTAGKAVDSDDDDLITG